HIPTWAPFAEFKRQALKTRGAVEDMMNIPFDMVKKQMVSHRSLLGLVSMLILLQRSGQARPCFTSNLLELHCDPSKTEFNSEDEQDIKGAAATLIAAAAEDTTVSVLQSFILAMVRHPEVFLRAREEIDRVTGASRLPNYGDRGSLPYLDCVLKEVLRLFITGSPARISWSPPVPLGMPHRVMEDNFYQGYYIPEGSTVLVNIFAILHDCPEPEEFLPERYLTGINYPDPREVVFGFGRRICPGRHFAETGIWMVLANIIATLDISRTVEDKTLERFPEVEFTHGFVRYKTECLKETIIDADVHLLMEALITVVGNTAVVGKVPIPEPAPNEIRIEVHAVSLNPVDALYTLDQPAPDDPGRVIGSDFAGVVDKVGPNVTHWKVGDRVTGFVQGATAENRRPGGFAQYAILEADLAIRIPSQLSFEEAATIPLCALTAAQMLFITLGINAPFHNPAKVTNELKAESPAILIYSASTSVGLFAVELALIARTPQGKPYRVFATASPKHHKKLLEKGVEAVLDYRDPEWPEKVLQLSGGIDAALDCIAEGDSVAKISHSFKADGGTIATVRREAYSRDGIKDGVSGVYSAVWVGLGHELYYYNTHYPASEDWRAFTVEFYKYLASHPERFPISPITPRIMPDGLHGIVPFAFPLLGDDLVIERTYAGASEYLKPISAEKLVFPLKSPPSSG
ncbi:hypothetical protein H0H93_013952, partial [Arthromyces matolae]